MPADTIPASGMPSAVICSATFTCRGVKEGVDCSNSAAPPLTMAAAMLVPLITEYALVPLPATCIDGYFGAR